MARPLRQRLRGLALTSLLADKAFGKHPRRVECPHFHDPPTGPRSAHFAPRARSVIFLYMDGGPSQVDTFDPKPRLQQENGKPFKMEWSPRNSMTTGLPWAARGSSALWQVRPAGQ